MILKADGFEPWSCENTCQLGINLENLNKVLKCMGSKDEVEIKYKGSQSEECDFVFRSPNEDKVSHFSLKLVDIDSEHLGIPDTDYKAQVQMASSEFQRICRDLMVLGDTLTIAVDKEHVQFSVNGDIGKGNMSIRNSTASDGAEDESTNIICNESVTQTFALRYLNFFTKATTLSGKVRLALSPEVPLMVEYQIDEIGHVRYYLAPKIED